MILRSLHLPKISGWLEVERIELHETLRFLHPFLLMSQKVLRDGGVVGTTQKRRLPSKDGTPWAPVTATEPDGSMPGSSHMGEACESVSASAADQQESMKVKKRQRQHDASLVPPVMATKQKRSFPSTNETPWAPVTPTEPDGPMPASSHMGEACQSV